jgi:uncharacterized protein YejL (UPF0352 family)
MNNESVPDDERVHRTSLDILNLLEEKDRALTRNDVVAIAGNITSNVIMAASQGNNKRSIPSQAGALVAIVSNLINHHVEMMVRQVYGKTGVGEFDESRFETTLQCVSLPHGDSKLIEVEKGSK